DAAEIARLLPHRYPFLLVDRVVELGEDKVVAIKNVTVNEPFFVGHFPGHPIMPGVLIVEAMAQAAAVMALKQLGMSHQTHVVYFMAIDRVKFRKPVVPGDQLRLEVVPVRKGGAVWKLDGKARVEGEVVAEAQFLASLQPRG